MSLRINDTAPDFSAETTQGPIRFHERIGDGWAVLFLHPKGFFLAVVALVTLALGMVPWTQFGGGGTAVGASEPTPAVSGGVSYFPSQYTNRATEIQEHIQAF